MSDSTRENNGCWKFMGLSVEAEVEIHYDKVGEFKASGEIIRSSWNTMRSHPLHQKEM
jgi:hypothetical protein